MLAALKSFYVWIETRLPRSFDEGLLVSAGRNSDVWSGRGFPVGRARKAKWLTAEAQLIWRRVGIEGYDKDGLPNQASRGRQFERNAAITDVLRDGGLRLGEAMSLMSAELPPPSISRSILWGRVQAGVTKNARGREFIMTSETRARVRVYEKSGRKAAIRRAQKSARYDALLVNVVIKLDLFADTIVYRTHTGDIFSRAFSSLNVADRLLLFVRSPEGLEPTALWLAEDGLPLRPEALETIFREANVRAERVLGPGAPRCRPHMFRHTFAVHMLLALLEGNHYFYRLSESERRQFEHLHGNPWMLVQHLLGHANESTTRDIYTEPIQGLLIRDLLSDPGGEEEWLDQIYKLLANSPLVVGVNDD